MSNILLAWELGDNAGHIMGLVPIAYRLRELGHQVFFAVKDLARIPAEHSRAFCFLQSPLWQQRQVGPEKLGYVDILAASSCASADGLRSLVVAWRQLLRLARADLVIAEHAPTALLAARACGVPALALDSGFTCPVAATPLPGFSALSAVQRQQLSIRETQVLTVCNRVLKEFGTLPLKALAELFHPARTLQCTYPELDHYGVRADANYLGPVYSEVQTPPPAWPDRYEHNIFVYLNHFKDWASCARAFSLIEANIIVVASGLPASDAAASAAAHIKIVTAPIALSGLLRQSRLVICHGGLGTTAASLAAGKPVLLLPNHREQLMLAERLDQQNLGHYLRPGFQAATLCRAVQMVLHNEAMQQAVASFAARHGDSVTTRVESISQRIHSALNGPKSARGQGLGATQTLKVSLSTAPKGLAPVRAAASVNPENNEQRI